MNINKSIQINMLLYALTFSPNLVKAVNISETDIIIQPSLSTGFMHYSFEQEAASISGSNFNSTREKIKFSDTMPTFSIGLGAGLNDFVFNISAQKAFNGSDTDTVSNSFYDERKDINSTYTNRYGVGLTNHHQDFHRYDYSTSIGYLLTEQLSIHIGYKLAKTKFKNESDSTFQITQFPNRLGGPLTDRDQFGGESKAYYNYEFQNKGPFIGLIYNLNYEDRIFKGKLYLSAALAFLDGDAKVKNFRLDTKITDIDGQPFSNLPTIRISGQSEFKGDTTGLTFGVKWIGETPINGLSYNLGLLGYHYQFDANDSSIANINEAVFQITAGVSYLF